MAEPGQPAAPSLGILGDVDALPDHRPGVGRRQPGQGPQQAGLAAAVAARQRQQFARAQPEGQAVEHRPAAAAAGQVFHLEKRGHFEKRGHHGALLP
jgi:hypothetical protein